MIVKIHRALAPPNGLGMVYAESRRFQLQTRLSPAILERMGERPKLYAEVAFEAGDLVVVRELPEQPW